MPLRAQHVALHETVLTLPCGICVTNFSGAHRARRACVCSLCNRRRTGGESRHSRSKSSLGSVSSLGPLRTLLHCRSVSSDLPSGRCFGRFRRLIPSGSTRFVGTGQKRRARARRRAGLAGAGWCKGRTRGRGVVTARGRRRRVGGCAGAHTCCGHTIQLAWRGQCVTRCGEQLVRPACIRVRMGLGRLAHARARLAARRWGRPGV